MDTNVSSVESSESDCGVSLQSNASVRELTPESLENYDKPKSEPTYDFNEFSKWMSTFSDNNLECVVFSDIEEEYPLNCDIECKFTILKNIEMKRGCRIGLYPVGLTEDKVVQECIASMSCFDCTTDSFGFLTRTLKFSKSNLTSINTNLMYQFCYIDCANQILGRSIPFIFRQASADDFVEVHEDNLTSNDSEGFVVVRSRQAILIDRLKQLSMNNGFLEFDKKKLMDELMTKKSEIKELIKQKAELESKCKLLQKNSNEKVSDHQQQLDFKAILKENEILKKLMIICKEQQNELQIKLASTLSDLEVERFKNEQLIKELDFYCISKQNKSEANLIFVLNNVKELNNTFVYSSPVYIRNMAWKILATIKTTEVENGNLNNYLGFYLCCDGLLFTLWTCDAEVKLTLVNQKDESKSISKIISQTFWNEECRWGLSKFAKWENIINQENGFCKNETIILKAKVETEEVKSVKVMTMKGQVFELLENIKKEKNDSEISYQDLENLFNINSDKLKEAGPKTKSYQIDHNLQHIKLSLQHEWDKTLKNCEIKSEGLQIVLTRKEFIEKLEAIYQDLKQNNEKKEIIEKEKISNEAEKDVTQICEKFESILKQVNDDFQKLNVTSVETENKDYPTTLCLKKGQEKIIINTSCSNDYIELRGKLAKTLSCLDQTLQNFEKSKNENSNLLKENENVKLKFFQMKKEKEQIHQDFEKCIKKNFEALNAAQSETKDLRMRLLSAKEAYETLYKEKKLIETKLAKLKSKIAFRKSQAEAFNQVIDEEKRSSKQNFIQCTECDEKILCPAQDNYPFVDHLQVFHQFLICPFCGRIFKNEGEDDFRIFELHVETHFDPPKFMS